MSTSQQQTSTPEAESSHPGAEVSAEPIAAENGRRTTVRWDWLVLAGAVALYLGLAWTVRSFFTDDSYISLRYARNLADGHGPVWNPGGPAVEGYSNPLLVLLEALVFQLGASGVGFARAVGVLSGVGLIAAIWYAGRPVVGARAAGAGAVLVAASPALAYWSVGGLETLTVALVLTLATLLLARPDGGPTVPVALLLAALPWLRPEGLVFAGALVACSELGGLLKPESRRRTLIRLAWLAGLPVLSQLALQGLRWAWYSHLLPNSVIYKGGTGRFGQVTYTFLVEAAPILALAAAGLVLVPRRSRLLAVVPAVYLVSSTTFLNSVNTFSRLVLPAFPLLIVLAAAALPGAVSRGREPRRELTALVAGTLALATVLVAVAPVTASRARVSAERYEDCRERARRDAGQWLRDNSAPTDSFAIGDAGLVPFLAGPRPVRDLFGLNEASIQDTGPTSAQRRAEEALAAAPRFFVLASSRSDRLQPVYGVDRRLARDPAFRRDYQFQTVAGGAAGCDYHLYIYRRTAPG